MKKIVTISFVSMMILGSAFTINWFIHGKTAQAGLLAIGNCSNIQTDGLYYTCTTGAEAPRVGQHMGIFTTSGQCHGNVVYLSSSVIQFNGIEDINECPFPLDSFVSLPLRAPAPPDATCNLIYPAPEVFQCSKQLNLNDTVALNFSTTSGCLGDVIASNPGTDSSNATVRITSNPGGCPVSIGYERSFSYLSTPPPAITIIDVPADYSARNWVYQVVAEGLSKGCGPKDANGNPIGPITTYCPTVPTTRGEMSVWILRMVHGQAYVPPIFP